MRGLAVCICMVGQSVAAETCATVGDTGLIFESDEPFIPFQWGETLHLTWQQDASLRKNISIGPVGKVEADKSVKLTNGMTLAYRTELRDVVTLGKQGTIPGVFLEGIINKTSSLGVTCGMTGGVLDAQWCLPFLERLRPEATGCEAGEN